MLKLILFLFALPAATAIHSQKIDSIYFHLYTDSLKKGTYNYINVDGKLSNGRYLPLNDKQVKFESNTGHWDGNNLIIDSSYKADSVVIRATLIERPNLFKAITIYIKKSTDEGKVYTEQELYENYKKKKKKKG